VDSWLNKEDLKPPATLDQAVIRLMDILSIEEKAGSRYFCESLFWASQPKQAAKT
jgi:hypothetical protein